MGPAFWTDLEISILFQFNLRPLFSLYYRIMVTQTIFHLIQSKYFFFSDVSTREQDK